MSQVSDYVYVVRNRFAQNGHSCEWLGLFGGGGDNGTRYWVGLDGWLLLRVFIELLTRIYYRWRFRRSILSNAGFVCFLENMPCGSSNSDKFFFRCIYHPLWLTQIFVCCVVVWRFRASWLFIIRIVHIPWRVVKSFYNGYHSSNKLLTPQCFCLPECGL